MEEKTTHPRPWCVPQSVLNGLWDKEVAVRGPTYSPSASRRQSIEAAVKRLLEEPPKLHRPNDFNPADDPAAELADEQPAGAHPARGATTNARGRSVSRWQVGTDAGRSQVAPRGRHEVGHAALPGYEPTRGSERSGMNAGANNIGSPSGKPITTTTRTMPQQMCEKLWTLPSKLGPTALFQFEPTQSSRLFITILAESFVGCLRGDGRC